MILQIEDVDETIPVGATAGRLHAYRSCERPLGAMLRFDDAYEIIGICGFQSGNLSGLHFGTASYAPKH